MLNTYSSLAGIPEAGTQRLEAPGGYVDPKTRLKPHSWLGGDLEAPKEQLLCPEAQDEVLLGPIWGLQPLGAASHCICRWDKPWAKPKPSGKGTLPPLALLECLGGGGPQHCADPEPGLASGGCGREIRGSSGLGAPPSCPSGWSCPHHASRSLLWPLLGTGQNLQSLRPEGLLRRPRLSGWPAQAASKAVQHRAGPGGGLASARRPHLTAA